ncbi:MAG TPA: DUF302 domain-containing protein [Mucilaginibacter sp.]|nr:DUF302 domain-containing protein [Mucilaginibacter sp.]
MQANADMEHGTGIVTLASPHTVKETADKLESALRSKGVTIFARIDQQAEAKKAALEMNAMELLIFGNPKAGTLLMEAEPLSGLDLPLKALVWQDNDKKVWLSYNSFTYLQQRFGLSDDVIKAVSGVEGLLKAAVL